jgi:hypothetical protein
VSANRIFLVCSKHPKLEDALCIGERATGEGQYLAPSLKRMDEWYAKHMGCSNGCDHFAMAYNRPRNWDVPKPADTVAANVRLEIAKAGLQ